MKIIALFLVLISNAGDGREVYVDILCSTMRDFVILSLSKGSMKWISFLLIFILLFKLYLSPFVKHIICLSLHPSPSFTENLTQQRLLFSLYLLLYCFSATGGREEINMLWSNYHKLVGRISKWWKMGH